MAKLTDKQHRYLGRYASTYDFVNSNNLMDVANKVLGKNWEASDDCEQIDSMLEYIRPNGFRVNFLEHCKFEEDIEVRETDSFSTDPVFLWFNHFVDFIQEIKPNLYNDACKYADKREEDSDGV